MLWGVLVSFLALWVAGIAHADERWTTIDIQNGLLDHTVHCLVPDPAGGVWVGTSRGLSHWDGHRWVSYSAGNGLAEGYITAVARDPQGSLWVGSWGGGLSALRGGRWERYSAASSPLAGDWIAGLAADQNGLWIATYGRGLNYLQDGRWSSYTRADSGLPSDWLTCLLPDEEGGLWVGTERAGLAYRDAQGSWIHYPHPGQTSSSGDEGGDSSDGIEITALAYRSAELWVGTAEGVAILDLGSGVWRTLGHDQGTPTGRITTLTTGADGHTMWIGTDQGLVCLADGQQITYTVHEGLPHNGVSATALDIEGRLWVGTWVRGLAVQGDLPQPTIARLPVVLVHGWRGPDSDLLEDSEFWSLARWLREDGFVPYYASGISPANTLYANALRLREVIAQARREANSSSVYIIAFSMGGLNARAYLESSLYQGDVARAFILGTPHRGEEIWEPLLLWEYLAWTRDPSALELMPMHAELFNRTHSNTWGVPYTLIAGDVSGKNISPSQTIPTLFRELPPSDGLVSTWSALGPEELVADRRITQDIHAWSSDTILLDVPSLLLPRATYDAHIRPYLFDMEDAPGTGSPASSLGYTPPEPEPRSAYRAGTITPGPLGITVTLPAIPLETDGRSRFYVRWKGPALKVSLRDPQGRVIDPDRLGDNSGKVEYLPLDFADFASFVLTDTLPGPWQVILSADSKNTAPTQYVAYAAMPSPVRLQVSAERSWVHLGERVAISATVEDPEAATTIEDIGVEVYAPDRQLVATLSLSSTQGTDSASPGVVERYEGAFVPQESGYYTLLVRAVGRRGRFALERGASLLVGVAGNDAGLSGHYALVPGHRAADGRLESLDATVGLVVRREGDYQCTLIVTDSLGHRVTQLAHPQHLPPGAYELSILLPGQAIAASMLDGPYRLSEVTLLDVSASGVLLDSASDVATSLALQHDDFTTLPRGDR